MRRHNLTPQAVEAVIDTLLREAEEGQRATVSALARRLQVNRQTLYRDFPEQITRLQTQQILGSAARRVREGPPPTEPPSPACGGRKKTSPVTCTSPKTTSDVSPSTTRPCARRSKPTRASPSSDPLPATRETEAASRTVPLRQ